ncbi:MAG: dihydrodipicolinate reductase [Myxococcota bacterium]|nr:dihydrodipicolinate reductase [Myxococcota bacterium]
MLQLAQIGHGALGKAITKDIETRADAEVTTIIDPSVDHALSHIEDFQNWSCIDCAVVTTESSLIDCFPTFENLLKRGQNIISTCEELSWPWLRHPQLANTLHGLAVKHKARILGAGVNPGFLMDLFPLMVTRVARQVEYVEVARFQDAASRRLPFQNKIGAGLEVQTFQKRIQDGTLRHVGLAESLHFLGDYLQLLPFDHWDETTEPVVGEDGKATGIRQVAVGTQGGVCVIKLIFQATMGQNNPHDRVRIQSDPPLEVTWTGGVHGDVATSAVVLNSIHPLLVAAPGLHTMATIPVSGIRTNIPQ